MNITGELHEHAMRLADHEGQFKGFSATIAAVQSSLGSWQTTVIGFGAALLAAFALLGATEIYNSNKIDTRADAISAKVDSKTDAINAAVDATGKRIDALDLRVGAISQDVKGLPAAISKEMISVARDIVTITRPIPQPQPPTPP